jgi:lipopolysaccharide transport system ATP-binding protein
VTEYAIRVEHLSKRYRIGQRERYRSLRDSLVEAAAAPLRRVRSALGTAGASAPKGAQNTIWALRDASFDVEAGEVLGIIGHNGAGKSTLLKILSRITEPTEGRAQVQGRVGSLLEVGTGFHPELTGRENIYLNGAILGMKRAEIARRFDEMVAFAEVERFIDTPVKRFSSGMYLRLAFAVAAHLEPEILVVDEVLSVGDVEFQRKCLGKMEDVARRGRTVLFVSHQLAAVKSLCSRAIQIHQGRCLRDGEPTEVVNQYLADGTGELRAERVWDDPEERPGNSAFRLVALRVVNERGELNGVYPSSRPILVEMEFDLYSLHSALCVGFDLLHRDGIVVFRSLQNDRHEREWPTLTLGRNRLRCTIPEGMLNYGVYSIAPKAGLHAIAPIVDRDADVSFEVQLDHSESPLWNIDCPQKFPGVIAPCLRWRALEGTSAEDRSPEAPRLTWQAL